MCVCIDRCAMGCTGGWVGARSTWFSAGDLCGLADCWDALTDVCLCVQGKDAQNTVRMEEYVSSSQAEKHHAGTLQKHTLKNIKVWLQFSLMLYTLLKIKDGC